MRNVIACGLCIAFAVFAVSCSVGAEEVKPKSSDFLLPDLPPGQKIVEVSPTPPDR